MGSQPVVIVSISCFSYFVYTDVVSVELISSPSSCYPVFRSVNNKKKKRKKKAKLCHSLEVFSKHMINLGKSPAKPKDREGLGLGVTQVVR